jgi:hypothetical protein
MSTRQYRICADITITIHFLWAFFLWGGFVVMLVYPSYSIIQIIAMSVSLLIAIPFHGDCPLTLLEKKLRTKFDPTYDNQNSCIATYLNLIFNTRFPARRVNLIITILYFLAYFIAVLNIIFR